MFSFISRTTSLPVTLASVDIYVKARRFAHVISLNPENFVEALHNNDLKSVYSQAEIIIADGIGILVAANILNVPVGDRITGVDLMGQLIHKYAQKNICFVGAHNNAAQKALEYFAIETKTSSTQWKAFPNVAKDDLTLIDMVVDAKPDLLFVAFGSPAQELWIEKYRDKLQGTVCVGIGQGLDVYAHQIKRAPKLMRTNGFEWLYRLVSQPWRWRRQLRLLKFIYFVLRYRFLAR